MGALRTASLALALGSSPAVASAACPYLSPSAVRPDAGGDCGLPSTATLNAKVAAEAAAARQAEAAAAQTATVAQNLATAGSTNATAALAAAAAAAAIANAALPSAGGAITGPLVASSHLTGNGFQANIGVNTTAKGSGVNGPSTAQVGLNINLQKDGWFNGTPGVGEIDGIYVTTRQGGVGSDNSGILVDVQNEGKGFLSSTEMVSSIVDPVANVLTQAIDVQEGILSAPTGDFMGVAYTANAGHLTTAIRVQTGGTGTWGNILENHKGNVVNFTISDDGNIVTLGGVSAALMSAGGFVAGADPVNGSMSVGRAGTASTPYVDFYGDAISGSYSARVISDAAGRLSILTNGGGVTQVGPSNLYTTMPIVSLGPVTAGGPLTGTSLALTGPVAQSSVLAGPPGASGAPTQRTLTVSDIGGAAATSALTAESATARASEATLTASVGTAQTTANAGVANAAAEATRAAAAEGVLRSLAGAAMPVSGGGFTGPVSGTTFAGAGGFVAGADAANGSISIGNAGGAGTPYLDFYGNNVAGNHSIRVISDAPGQLTILPAPGGQFTVAPSQVYSSLPLVVTTDATVRRHLIGSGAAAPASSVGAVSSGSSDMRGSVALPSGSLSTAITFATPYASPPFCVASTSSAGSVAAVAATSTTALNLALSANPSGVTATYQCMQ